MFFESLTTVVLRGQIGNSRPQDMSYKCEAKETDSFFSELRLRTAACSSKQLT